MSATYGHTWASLPEHIVVRILSHLSQYDRCMAGFTCRHWLSCFHSPYLWQRFLFSFQISAHEKQISCAISHGHHMKYVSIDVDQFEEYNRSNACRVLDHMATLKERKLVALTIRFTGENPFFYAGLEFVECLKRVFTDHGDTSCKDFVGLTYVDLSGLTIAYDDNVMNVLSKNNPKLEYLNIQNDNLVCKVTPYSMLRLVQCCKHLKYLLIYHSSICDSTLTALAEQDNRPIKHLSIICRREQKFTEDLSEEAWSSVTVNCPDLRVTLGFDHTCPLGRVSEIMKPQIPVSVLRLETFTTIFEEVRLATRYYKDTLTKLVLQTRPSVELSAAILDLCSKCHQLQSLLVYCVLDKETVDAILELKPEMKRRGSYILKWELEPEPWIVGYEDDYISDQKLNVS